MTKQLSKYEQSQNVIYDNCKEDDTIGGQKLSTIVGFAIQAMELTIDTTGLKADKLFKIYCDGLDRKIGSSEPYYISVDMKEKRKDRIVNDMKRLLPNRVEKFDKLIESAAERAVAVLDVSATRVEQLIYRSEKDEFVVSEFSVLKLFRSGENLEITPCYMSIKGKKSGGRLLFIASWEETEAKMTYQQKKYILTKFDIEQIIKKLQEKAKSRW